MSRKKGRNLPASIRQRLLDLSRRRDESFDQLLQYYVIERFLYRLSQSRWADVFIVKGATLLRVWQAPLARPTRDIDFLAHVSATPEAIVDVVKSCLAQDIEDGLRFEDEIATEAIRVDGQYPGVRAAIRGDVSGALFRLQLDVGVGDDTVPDPGWVDYPTLLDMPAPRILAYDPATSVAEKFEAMVSLGEDNSRLKDFYDIWLLATSLEFRGEVLTMAMRATFQRRGTPLPAEVPAALRDAFVGGEVLAAWKRFLRKSGMAEEVQLIDVLGLLRAFLMPPAEAAAGVGHALGVWSPGGRWSSEPDSLPAGRLEM